MVKKRGVLFLAGIGPGDHKTMTNHCIAVFRNCDVVVGYKKYIELAEPFIEEQQVISSGMTQEVERCNKAIQEAAKGKRVALISSGDSGLALEIVNKKKMWDRFTIEIIPGVPVIHAAAARLGAPLMNDYAVISLSDLLTPWEVIEKRLHHAAQSDMVICLYNPKSKKRTTHIQKAKSILLQNKKPDTPVGIARNVGRNGEALTLTTISKMLRYKIDMVTIIIIGNSSTHVLNNRMITQRGYRL
jgi:precorrin-3B C17-methyltransferase